MASISLTNFLTCLAFLSTLAFCGSQAFCRSLDGQSMMVRRHEEWMAKHGRTYKDMDEKARRCMIFKQNVEWIDNFNTAGLDRRYTVSVNEFADLSNEEFRAMRNGYKRQTSKTMYTGSSIATTSFRYANLSDVPASVDWRQKGAVTPIKDQQKCGCCWAFSAVASMEGINQLKTGKLISLSEQELVDCDTKGEDQGCGGGLMDNAFQFIIQNHGLTTEDNYPYKGADGTCNSNKTTASAATITGYEDVPANDEKALLQAVASHPVSVAIDAAGTAFQFYSSGIFNGTCGTNLDHGVTAVGYGANADGTKYWLVKNSWGTGWGEDGYIKMQRDIDAKEGLCGIAMEASYPTV